MKSFYIFFTFITTMVFLIWFNIWRRVVLPANPSKPILITLKILFILSFLLQVITPFYYRHVVFQKPQSSMIPFWVSYSVFGFMIMLFFCALFKDVIFVFLQKMTSTIEIDPSRRLLILRGLSLGAFGLAVTGKVMGMQTAMAGPEVKNVDVPIKDLPKDLDGFTIAQITDLHVGSTIRRSEVEKVVAKTNALNPHVVFVTGDSIDGSVEQLNDHVEPLRNLKPQKNTYYVTGNHEYYWDVDSWTEKYRSFGWKVLENQHEIISHGKSKLLIAGVRDYSCGRMRADHVSDPRQALGGGQADFKILLAHQPKSCYEASDAGFDLMMSGHTHGGQFFPISLLARLVHRYLAGLYRHQNKMWVYVNRGTGYWGPPNRFALPSEITLLRLKTV